MFGQVFRKGDVPSGQGLVLDSTASQVVPISTWDDGSVKHALVAGRADFVANVPKTFTVAKAAASAGALTEADLISASPTASVSYGSYGTVSLAPLLGTAARAITEHAGPQYVAFQYIAAFPNDATVRAVFYVQLWSNGRYRVRVAVENGTAPFSGSSKSGTATVIIDGVQRYNGTVSMAAGTRWDIVAMNGTDPNIVPAHDHAYLRATKLVPNYGWTANNTILSALGQNYSPMAALSYPVDMGGTGAGDYIGILQQSDACYCTTADARAWRSVMAHGRAMGVYSIFFRDASTRRMPKMSDYPTAYVGGQRMTGGGTNTYQWEFAHHPGAGYLAWLLTGERFYLETMQANGWAAYVTNSGSGATRIFNSQVRGKSWRFRTMAQNAAVGPDGDAFKADAKAIFMANVTNYYNNHAVPNSPGTGLMFTAGADPFDNEPSIPGVQKSAFEYLFGVASLGFAWDIEMKLDATQKSQLLSLRDYFYNVPVGLTGRGPANGEYFWRRAPGPYRLTIGSGGTESSPILYNSWGEVYANTYPDGLATGNTLLEAYADDPSDYAFAEGNWGHVITALSYAVDHGKPGALEGWNRLIGASNWATNTNKYAFRPNYGVKPRSVP